MAKLIWWGGSGGGGSFNPHAPGTIGDLTPAAGYFTSLAAVAIIATGGVTSVATDFVSAYDATGPSSTPYMASFGLYSQVSEALEEYGSIDFCNNTGRVGWVNVLAFTDQYMTGNVPLTLTQPASSGWLTLTESSTTYLAVVSSVVTPAYPTIRTDGSNIVLNPGSGGQVYVALDTASTTLLGGGLDVAGTINISGNDNLPIDAGTGVYLAGAFGSPVAGKMYIGDGSGWQVNFSSRTASVDTDLWEWLDNGALTQLVAQPVTLASALIVGNAVSLDTGLPGLSMNISGTLAWSGTANYFNTKDTSLSRLSAGSIGVGTGAYGSTDGGVQCQDLTVLGAGAAISIEDRSIAAGWVLYSEGGSFGLYSNTLGQNVLSIDANGCALLSTVTVTANDPALSITQTWDNAAVVFDAMVMNITNTASAAGSMLMDLQVASVSKFNVGPTGLLNSADGANFGGQLLSITGDFVSYKDNTPTAACAFGTYSYAVSASTSIANFDFFNGTAWSNAAQYNETSFYFNVPIQYGPATTGGANSALLGTNCPATHFSAPYSWVNVTAPDGTPCVQPIWQL